MRNTLLLFGLICYSINSYSQVLDTVYFDMEGEIFIKELATYYRIAKYDTTNGHVLDQFKDYTLSNDSMIASGTVHYSRSKYSIKDYKGDSEYLPIATNMVRLKASYIRLRDYPALREVIIPSDAFQERSQKPTEDGQFFTEVS